MRDPWVWPDNPAYPPWPHLRYPLTSKDEDPNKKILARQSCSRERRTLLFYLTRTAYHALPHTKHANNSPTTRDTPILGCLLTRDPWVLPAKPDIPPHGRTSRSFIQKARGQYCFISLTQDTMHYLTQNTPPNPTIKGTHIRVPFGQDLWVWPDNPAYPPPQPHLRYPLTSTDEDPNKRFVRQSCSRAQRTLLFYLTHTEYHEGYLFEVVPSCTTKNTLK